MSKVLVEFQAESLGAWLEEHDNRRPGYLRPDDEKTKNERLEVATGRAAIRTHDDGRLWWAPDWGDWRRSWCRCCGQERSDVEEAAADIIQELKLEGVTVSALADGFYTIIDHYNAATHQAFVNGWGEVFSEYPEEPVIFFDLDTLNPTCVFCWDCKKFFNVPAEVQEGEARRAAAETMSE